MFFNVVSTCQTHKHTDTHISSLSLSLSLSPTHLYLEVGLAVMAEVWEWGLPASGSLVLSPSAEEREISPVHKHTGITHYQGLMDASLQCWVMFVQHAYLCIYTSRETGAFSVHVRASFLRLLAVRLTPPRVRALWASQAQKPMRGRLVSESKSTHDKLSRYTSTVSNLNHAMLFTYKLCPCQSVGGYLFVRINIGIFYSVYLQVLPSQWVGSYLFVQNQYFCYILTC